VVHFQSRDGQLRLAVSIIKIKPLPKGATGRTLTLRPNETTDLQFSVDVSQLVGRRGKLSLQIA
jgi:hypothetical protein